MESEIFYYPENLNSSAKLLFWTTRNAIIIAALLVGSVLGFVAMGIILPFVILGVFAFMTFEIAESTVYSYTKLLTKYVIFDTLKLFYDGSGTMIPRKNTTINEMNIHTITDDTLELIGYRQKQVFVLVQPINVAVLPPEYMRERIDALTNSMKSITDNNIIIEILCVNSTQSYDSNKEYLADRIAQESNRVIRQMLQKDLLDLDKMRLSAAANREFVVALTFNQSASPSTVNNKVNRLVQTLNEGTFSTKIAEKEDYKRLLAIYYEQRMDIDDLSDYDGEKYIAKGEIDSVYGKKGKRTNTAAAN